MSHCYQPHKYAVIRNQYSGLVLDASEYIVKMQHYTGFPSQLWKLESAGPGKFIIVNKGNGKALDIQGGLGNGNNLITFNKHGGINQQWYINSDNTIVSAGGNLAVDIEKGHNCAGNSLIAWNKHGQANQQFLLQYQ